ncbi:MAG: TetR/AcrR family transcriptional regulator [Corynebacteriales bacterium]|nr:TetR/AcrR family transcriptional regulator [Mycobacteriales bacterium]
MNSAVTDLGARAGTRVRAGNAMSGTRQRVLQAASVLIAARGVRRMAMAELAREAGVAKGTLYNHFRTKEEVLNALVVAAIGEIADACATLPLEAALDNASMVLSTHPLLRQLREHEPEQLGALAQAQTNAAGWRAAHEAVRKALLRAGKDADHAELVLRHLASFLIHPSVSPSTSNAALAALLPADPHLPNRRRQFRVLSRRCFSRGA